MDTISEQLKDRVALAPFSTAWETAVISVVIPMHNEAESVGAVVEELLEVEPALARRHLEIILVDDGSTDETWNRIAGLTEAHAGIRGFKLRKNFGKGTALKIGFQKARGEYLVTMDGDLQDDARHLPDLVAMLDGGYDVVTGWKRNRHDPWHKVAPSRILNFVVRRAFHVPAHDLNCGFKAFRRELIERLPLYGELYRYMIVFAKEKGFRIGELPVNHRRRIHGKSKYGWARLVRGFLDLLTVRFLTAFETRPLHLLGSIGLILMLAGGAGLTYLAILWVLGLGPIGSRPLLAYSGIGILFGAQLITFGILAELIVAKTGVNNGQSTRQGAEIEQECCKDLSKSSRQKPATVKQ